MSNLESRLRRYAGMALAGFCLLATVGLLSLAMKESVNDYTVGLRPTTAAWLAGRTRLFDIVGQQYYALPWAVWLIAPTLLFPANVGQAILGVGSLIGVSVGLKAFAPGFSISARLMAATPFWVFMLLLTGNLDGYVLLGMGLSWWAIQARRPLWLSIGLWFITLKPVNALPFLVLAGVAIWRWSWGDKLKALVWPLLALVVSFPIFGWDWPARYLHYTLTSSPPYAYPIISLWKISSQVGVPLAVVGGLSLCLLGAFLMATWKYGVRLETLAFGLALWMIITPYALDYHYLLLLPAFLVTARYSRPLALGAYLCTYGLPLLRIPFGFSIIAVDLLYPILLGIGSGLALWRLPSPTLLNGREGYTSAR